MPFVFLLALTTNNSSKAAAPVEELGGPGARTTGNAPRVTPGLGTDSSTARPAANNDSYSDPFYRMQLLQEELRQLRGMIEEQAHELTLLKKRQQEDYLDLDRRLTSSKHITPGASVGNVPGGGVSSSNPAVNVTPTRSPPRSANDANIEMRAGGSAEKKAYDQAYGLLKARRIDDAKNALKRFKQNYPSGPYTANAHYWLGELYLLAEELPEAEAEFSAIVQKYPAHRKVNDATFKLGKIYHMQNKPKKARMLLELVAAGSGGAAKLAQDYLRRNF